MNTISNIERIARRILFSTSIALLILYPDLPVLAQEMSKTTYLELGLSKLQIIHGAFTDQEKLSVQAELEKQYDFIHEAIGKRSLSETLTTARVPLSGNEASALKSAIWSKHPKIAVYFENATPEQLQNECQWIKIAVEGSWGKAADIVFSEWKQLPGSGSNGGIRIRFAEGDSFCKRLGKFLRDLPGGVSLNVTFHAQGFEDCSTDENVRKKCIERTAIHEFGHVLGLAHEQNRPDAPAHCREQMQGQVGDKPVTIYDPSSIMNYCNPLWNNGGVLSDLDKIAAADLYGERTP